MPRKKKEEENNEPVNKDRVSVIEKSITDEMKESYISYAMSVITSRALPDVRDGLKPVHRRILFAMHEMGLTPTAKTRKSAAVVGDVLGKYHPHGDMAVYDAMVGMAQDFSMRYPLVIGQGNFGSIDGDPPAAQRYTEAKMSKLSTELLKDLEKETVNFRANYDNTKKEPEVLPAKVPNLLLNGTLGIAVGMATNIPPHNLSEVVDATVAVIEKDNVTNEDLMEYIKGPDFPTGGIAYNQKDISAAYATGRGGVVVRGEAEIVEQKAGQSSIIITSIPYRVNKANLIESIAKLVQEKKLDGIKGLRDESASDIRVVIDLKNSAYPQKVLNYLYKHTQLEQTFHYNTVALVDGVPQTLSLKSILESFVDFRREVVRRRTEFDLKKAKDREHILLGLKKALDHIDEVISTIRKSKDGSEAKTNLMKKFKFTELQTVAILEMRLQKLAGLERKAVLDELKEKQDLIKELEALLASEKKILAVIKEELVDMKERYGDDRRTKVVKGGVKNISNEDLIPEKESILVYTEGGYVKRTDPSEYKSQKRGGVGVIDISTKEEDFVTDLVAGGTHDDVLFFTNMGKAYQIKMYELPEGKRATKGKSIMNFLSLSPEEKVTSIRPIPKSVKKGVESLLFVTKKGKTKKAAANSFSDVRRSGIIAIKLDKGDELVSVCMISKGDEVIFTTRGGQALRAKDSDFREMGRSAGGVTGMKLKQGDEIISAQIITKEDKNGLILVVGENGLGKKTALKEYKTQNRGGSGIKTMKVTPKTGKIIAAKIVSEDTTEMVAMSKKGQVIRVDIDSISTSGRDTQGVSIMKLRAGDAVASVAFL
ncbi:DNA gyrase subunit A [Candidatus Nomurabacteria bacterium]|nr:DNA gyrase subunit A [Candidatus Nomurabacteria bacterium]